MFFCYVTTHKTLKQTLIVVKDGHTEGQARASAHLLACPTLSTDVAKALIMGEQEVYIPDISHFIG